MLNLITFLQLILLHYSYGLYKAPDENLKDIVTRNCVHAAGHILHLAEDGGPENISAKLPYKECENTTSYCFSLWEELPDNGSIKILEQGKLPISLVHISKQCYHLTLLLAKYLNIDLVTF